MTPTTALGGALESRTPKHMATLTNPSEIVMLMRNINSYPHKEWRIPAEKMKMKRVHIVPLATQTIEFLRFLQELTGKSKWLLVWTVSR